MDYIYCLLFVLCHNSCNLLFQVCALHLFVGVVFATLCFGSVQEDYVAKLQRKVKDLKERNKKAWVSSVGFT